MKKLLTATALLSAMFAASPALADDPQAYAAYQFTQAVIYHTGCEKLPDQLMYGIVQAMKTIPESVLVPATTKVTDEIKSDGSSAAWCARIKPIIWKHIKETQP
jgi:hypothetical protein